MPMLMMAMALAAKRFAQNLPVSAADVATRYAVRAAEMLRQTIPDTLLSRVRGTVLIDARLTL